MNALDALLGHPILDALGWTLLHFVWQGAAVAVVLAVALAALRNRSPGVRYHFASVGLGLLAALPVGTFGVLLPRGGEVAVVQSEGAPASGAPGMLPTARAEPAPRDGPRMRLAQPAGATIVPLAATPTWRGRVEVLLEPVLPWCVLGWAGGVLALSVPLIGGWWNVRRLRRRATLPAAMVWQRCLADLARRLGISRPVRLLESSLTQVPIVLGWLRPVILLPACAFLGLTPPQLEAVLAHELAHVRRYDYLVNLVQSVVETLLFYHPAVWWLSRRMRIERELCCDDLAVRTCSNALVYARALTALEQLRLASPTFAVAASGGALLPRVRRIVGLPAAGRPAVSGWVAGLVASCVLIGVTVTSGALGTRTAVGQEPASQSTPSVRYRPIPGGRGETVALTGVVTDADSRPVAGAPVLVWPNDDEVPTPQQTLRTDAEGRFTLAAGLADGYWRIQVDDPRYAREWHGEHVVLLPIAVEQLPLCIRLDPPQAFIGTVVNEEGVPVPEVTATLAREWLHDAENNDPVQGWLAFDLQVTTTDADGRFRLERLRPGRIMVMLDHPDYARTLTDILRVADGRAPVTIRRGLTLRGRVQADGHPLAGVQVQINATNLAHRSLGQWHLTTGEDGTFEVGHVTSLYEAGGYVVQTVAVLLDDPSWVSDIYAVNQPDAQTLPFVDVAAWPATGAQREPKVIQLGRAEGVIHGRVPDQPAGTAIIEVRLAGITAPTDPRRSICVWRQCEEAAPVFRESELSSDGAAVFRALPAGQYAVSTPNYSSPNYLLQTVAIGDGESVSVTLEKGAGKITGTLRADGVPLSIVEPHTYGAGCGRIVGDGAEHFFGQVFGDGRFEIDGVPPGLCTLGVWGRDCLPQERCVEVPAGEVRVDIDLPGGCITGHVAGIAEPVPDGTFITVCARAEKTPLRRASALIPVGADGTFTIRRVPPGEYSLSIRVPPNGALWRATATLVDPGAAVAVELRAPEETGWIEARLNGWPGVIDTQSGSTFLTAMPRDATGYDLSCSYGGTPTVDGQALRIKDVPPGVYALRFTTPGAPLLWIPRVEVRAGQVAEIALQLPSARDVRITLAYVGRQPASAIWRIRLPSGDWLPFDVLVYRRSTDIVAPAEVFGLPFGPYTVEACFGPGITVVRDVTVAAGAGVQEVVIEMP